MAAKWIDLGDGNKILVEVDESLGEIFGETDGDGNRLITGKKSTKVHSLMSQLQSLAESINSSAQSLSPNEIELTGQVKFSGEAGIPVFVNTKGETAFQIKLKWKRQETKV